MTFSVLLKFASKEDLEVALDLLEDAAIEGTLEDSFETKRLPDHPKPPNLFYNEKRKDKK